jgi:hypothetical protein
MNLSRFEAPRLKLQRARHHYGDLINRIREYLIRKPFHLVVEAAGNGYPGGKKWAVHVREEVPKDFSAIVGDVIHNFRTSLDLLACELVRANNQDDEGVYFPFAKSAGELNKVIKKRHMDRASPAVVALIKKNAPYKGGNSALRAIHDLDIIDKHQSMIPLTDMAGTPQLIGLPPLEGPSVGPIHDGAAFQVMPAHLHLPIGTMADGIFTFRFSIGYSTITGFKQTPLAGSEVVPTLISLSNVVESLINEFARIA